MRIVKINLVGNLRNKPFGLIYTPAFPPACVYVQTHAPLREIHTYTCVRVYAHAHIICTYISYFD